jgi:hypothetical protein
MSSISLDSNIPRQSYINDRQQTDQSGYISGYIPIFIPGDGGGVSDVSVRSELSELVDDPEKLRLIGNGGG